MTMVLFFVIFFVVISAWDVARINRLYDKMLNPASRRKTPSESRASAPPLVCEHDARERAARSS